MGVGGMGSFDVDLGVSRVAEYLQVSVQRVRRLLAQGRLRGWKDPQSGEWKIPYPFTLVHGRRGPKLGQKPAGSSRSPGRNSKKLQVVHRGK